MSEFKKESFVLFEGLLEKIKIDVVKYLFNLNLVIKDEEEETAKIHPPFQNKKIGRNDKCLCGSGKKYKHCCNSI